MSLRGFRVFVFKKKNSENFLYFALRYIKRARKAVKQTEFNWAFHFYEHAIYELTKEKDRLLKKWRESNNGY
jgi:hypothetical protein